jgi:hypothetical protein
MFCFKVPDMSLKAHASSAVGANNRRPFGPPLPGGKPPVRDVSETLRPYYSILKRNVS